jgi:hypothetical protein
MREGEGTKKESASLLSIASFGTSTTEGDARRVLKDRGVGEGTKKESASLLSIVTSSRRCERLTEESARVRRRRDASLLSSVTPSGLPVVCNESRTYETRRERMSESYATRLDLFCRYRQGEGREGVMEEE